MVSRAHPRRPPLRRPRDESATGTLVALLLATLVPLVLAAVALGWRPPLPDLGPLRVLLNGREAPPAAGPTLPGSPLPQGWFFPADGANGAGFAVTDTAGAPFWTALQELGGPGTLGFPLSHRFECDGAPCQLFQRGLLRADPATGAVKVGALLDELHAAGFDEQLAAYWGIPAVELPASGEPAADQWAERVNGWLAEYPPLRQYLAETPAARRLLGLPTSAVHDVGAFYIARFQNSALQQWKADMPWAAAGAVTPVNVGEIAVTLGYFGGEPLVPQPAPAQ
ncbi:MAG TPA: hypothetical protein VKZ60_08875 [Chloroflexota bacterium]|jgi:hypothetical protein|nr:hypothetical protein [Chloroflexota bacterium]